VDSGTVLCDGCVLEMRRLRAIERDYNASLPIVARNEALIRQIEANVARMPETMEATLRPIAAHISLLRSCLQNLIGVAQELSANDAGPHWDDLCRALAGARAVLREGER
jgi:hypothetical protein